MWIFPKYKTNLTFGHAQGQYGAFNKNVRRNWGVWPMWISSANDKGFLATASTIVYDDNGRVDGRGLWAAPSITGNQWYDCDFDDQGHSYFAGNGTVKRDIMSSTQLWLNTSTQSSIDYSVGYNNNFIYIGSQDSIQTLRKVDTNGNLIWSKGITSSRITSITFDESNNIYVCGLYTGVGYNGIVAKYDESGNQLWSAYTPSELLDIKYYNKSPQIAPIYIGCVWQNNSGTANDGAIHLRSSDGVDAGYFGNELRNRNTTANNGYYSIEVNDRYVIAIDEEGNTQGLDVYMRNLNTLTASMTASQFGVSVPRLTDLELYEDTLYYCDFDEQRIYRVSSTFSRVEESWRVASQPRAIKMKKTY
jgi:hypothetical protein